MKPVSSTDLPDDELLFTDDLAEPEAASSDGTEISWCVVVVDDDESFHVVTRLALRNLTMDGTPIRLAHARSGAEARVVLKNEPDCALVLLDVVMEQDDAGLRVAEWIRAELQNPLVRVVLRTGQSGLAPEERVMQDYDIHDYHSKTELTAQRLRTAVTGAVRAYRDLRTVSLQRRSLEKVIAATSTLFTPAPVEPLLNGILEQVAALLVPREHALFFLARQPLFTPVTPEPRVIAASGRYAHSVGVPVAEVLSSAIVEGVESTAVAGEWRFIGQDGVFGFDVGTGDIPALFLEDARSLGEWEQKTIALFCASAAMALRNQHLHAERQDILTAFSRFVPSEFLHLLGTDDARTLKVGDQRVRTLSVCFLDVQGFTARSKQLGPVDIFALLNRIYGAIGPVLTACGGIIDKYMGDGVMVLFPTGTERALAAMGEVQRVVSELNQSPDLCNEPVVVRCSADHGVVMLGTVGHAGRFDTTVISDVANLAARLQGWCRTLDANILVTEAALGGARPEHTRALGSVTIRGLSDPVNVFEVYADAPAHVRAQKAAAAPWIARGLAYRAAGDDDEALSALRRAVALAPGDRAAAWLLSDMAMQHAATTA